MSKHILVIDEGTTSTRAIAYDAQFKQVAVAQHAIALSYPNDGWVEQDAAEIWKQTLAACQAVIAEIGGPENVVAIGITNQRETTIVWDRKTGEPIAPAIIWQDRRTAEACEALKHKMSEADVQAETGLLLDPYFSGTKLAWLLDNVEGARHRAEAGELAFGTVDSYLIWKLTGGKVHATDATNASRTLLYRLGIGEAAGWSAEMLSLLNIPGHMLPDVRGSQDDYGVTTSDLFGRELPIFSAIGDQQSALVGQGCLSAGKAKITYGTGAFLVANTGITRPASNNRLLGTVGFTREDSGAMAMEGSIFNAGTVVQWLRDDLGLIEAAEDSEQIASALPNNGGVYIVPAFTGLGAPHWDANARGTISGITRATQAGHLVRAGLESAVYQTNDLLEAFAADGIEISELFVDGGMAANDWLMQFLADVIDLPVFRPDYSEMTALGAAALAGMQAGLISAEAWEARKRPGTRFTPNMNEANRDSLLNDWDVALGRTLTS